LTLAALGAPLAIALVLFAGRNHRAPERSLTRLTAQVAWLLVVFAVTDILVSTFL
jgi:uncharacterized membrane protein YozB (DUF420 family)